VGGREGWGGKRVRCRCRGGGLGNCGRAKRRGKEGEGDGELEGSEWLKERGDLHEGSRPSLELRVVAFSSQEASDLLHVGFVVDLGICGKKEEREGERR